MKKRMLAMLLIFVLLLGTVPAANAEDTDSSEPDGSDAMLDLEQFGEGAVVERDTNGNPVSVNGYPVRLVHAGINFRSRKDATQYSLYFADYPFWQSATVYNGNLAEMSLAMALSANRAINPSEESIETFDPSLHLEQYLSEAGFESIRKDDYSKETSMYTISMAMGMRRMEHAGEEPFTLIAIGVCGGGYKNEWQSNLTPGEGEIHEGFLSASELVIDRLAGYLMLNHISGRVKIWISGFSRAAAVSNVTAALLVRDGIFSTDDVYAYTFATPAAVSDSAYIDYPNIFNIINPMDVVPQVMPSDWDFCRFGRDLYLPVTEFSSGGNFFTDYRAEYARSAFDVEANYSPALNLRMRLLLSMILDVAESRERYNESIQPAILSIMQSKDPSNMLKTLKKLLPALNDNTKESRINLDTLMDYIVRVSGNIATRTELRTANQNSGGIARRLFNEHNEDAYLANIELIRSNTFEDDFRFTYVFIRGPVDVFLEEASEPGDKITLTEKGELVPSQTLLEMFRDDPSIAYAFASMIYMERIGNTTVLALPHDSQFIVSWNAVKNGTVEVRLAECSVHASARYEGLLSQPIPVHAGDTGIAYTSESKPDAVPTENFTRTTFHAADLAEFIGIASIGINWRLALMIAFFLLGILFTLIAYLIVRAQKNRKKRGLPVWLCIGVFFIALLEIELSYWAFADRILLLAVWKIVMGLALAVLSLLRSRQKKSPLSMLLPALLTIFAADVLSCWLPLPGAFVMLLGHMLMILFFLRCSPMRKGKWIQWIVVSLVFSAIVVVSLTAQLGSDVWIPAIVVPVLLLTGYSVGNQHIRIRYSVKILLVSDILVGVFIIFSAHPFLHMVYTVLFYFSLLLLSAGKPDASASTSPVPQPTAQSPAAADNPTF